MVINVEFNVIKKAANRLTNIIHVKNYAKKLDLTVVTAVVNIAIQAKNVLNSHVKLKFLLSVNVVIDKPQFFVECQKTKNIKSKLNAIVNVKI